MCIRYYVAIPLKIGVVMKKSLNIIILTIVALPVAFAGYVWWRLQPKIHVLPLPEHLMAIDSAQGQALLDSADAVADYRDLAMAYQSQELISYCGVASAATVLNAMGKKTAQNELFTTEASRVRSRIQVTLGGMSLTDLDGLLSAHRVATGVTHGDTITLDEFRHVVESNLSQEGDFLLVNYQREALGQGRGGHISPLAAYDSASDRVLIMDTASYKYPYTWVPVRLLFSAMQAEDSTTGAARGYIEVGQAKMEL